jgi:hypothetical protein
VCYGNSFIDTKEAAFENQTEYRYEINEGIKKFQTIFHKNIGYEPDCGNSYVV